MQVDFRQGGRSEWSYLECGNVTLHYAGREASIRLLIDGLASCGEPSEKTAARLLRSLPGHFAFAMTGFGWGLAAVDSVRGYPLFYALRGEKLYLSGCARTVRATAGSEGVDTLAALELYMSGYATGNATIDKGVLQIQAGEALFWKNDKQPESFRYYSFLGQEYWEEDEVGLIKRLARATDIVFDRLVEDLNGRPVWVPLSAGLDSRLIVSKLKERDYPAIHTFSYGIRGNHEARHARKVAQVLGVPWRFVPTSSRSMRTFHESLTRREYWNYCDGLSSVPNPQDIVPLLTLRGNGVLPDDAVIVNGQSGDFSCGAHIPLALVGPEANQQMLVDLILAKHFALWRDMMVPANTNLLQKKLHGLLAKLDSKPDTSYKLAAIHDCWEWQERQAKYVVNGQRVYDFLGLDWRLPLWDKEWNEFWPRVPIPSRLGRNLHKTYLSQWDYLGLFSGPDPNVTQWPGTSFLLFIIAQVIGLTGRRAKDTWYSYARWFGHYGYQWKSYSFTRFLQDTRQARHLLAFYTKDWCKENVSAEMNWWKQ